MRIGLALGGFFFVAALLSVAAADETDPRRIVGGSETTYKEYPFVVWVEPGCTGSLISAHWVLTAAHCASYSHDEARPRERMEVRRDGESRFASLIILHPDWVPGARRSTGSGWGAFRDIALLRLDRPFEHFEPVSVLSPSSAMLAAPRTSAHRLGHGWNPRLANRNALQFIVHRIVASDGPTCRDAFDSDYADPEDVLCTPSHGFSVGDSGGPLLVEGPDGRFRLAGVEAKYYSSGVRRTQVNLFTRVTAVYDWIRSTSDIDIEEDVLSIQVSSTLSRGCAWTLVARHNGDLKTSSVRVIAPDSSEPVSASGQHFEQGRLNSNAEFSFSGGTSTHSVIRVSCPQP